MLLRGKVPSGSYALHSLNREGWCRNSYWSSRICPVCSVAQHNALSSYVLRKYLSLLLLTQPALERNCTYSRPSRGIAKSSGAHIVTYSRSTRYCHHPPLMTANLFHFQIRCNHFSATRLGSTWCRSSLRRTYGLGSRTSTRRCIFASKNWKKLVNCEKACFRVDF